MRQPFPDGDTWVRTEPIAFLEGDYAPAPHRHAWHQLTAARTGHLEVETEAARALIPPDRAVWIPAGLLHRERYRAPVAVRTVYLAPGAWPSAPLEGSRTLEVSSLLGALLSYLGPRGALDCGVAKDAHLIAVLVDLLAEAPEVSLRLPTPRDPRARRLAELLRQDLTSRASLDALVRRTGGSRRTLERCFRRETGLSIGAWRQRLRLLSAVRPIEAGRPISEVAHDVGYATPSAFSAAFRALFGRPPSALRAPPAR